MTLTISVLPGASGATPSLLVVPASSSDREDEGEPVQVLESTEYRYEVTGGQTSTVLIEPAELFYPDDASRSTGRFRPGLSTGRLPIEVSLDGYPVGGCAVEVRSRKLQYLSEYRWMLRDIAEIASEILLERFAPSEQRLTIEGAEDARTLYQRFAFLQSLFFDEEFAGSLRQVIERPYVQWRQIEERRSIREGIRIGSRNVRQLLGPGSRVPVKGTRLPSVPERIDVSRQEESLDNVPNRFVKFALEQWRGLAARVHDALLREADAHPVERGLRQTRALLDQVDALLSEELFRQVRSLNYFPSENPVLRRREGYRDIYRAWVLFEIAAKLGWEGGEEVFGAGKRNVATLYEFWVFLQLANLVSDLTGSSFDPGDVITADASGLRLILKQGEKARVRGSLRINDRPIDLELWFNRTFGTAGSWTRPLRPDVSLGISSRGDPIFAETWVHFDAKYRIDSLHEALGYRPASEEEEERVAAELENEVSTTRATRDDLLKMHAYKDAIRRSSGAYVVYPGDQGEHLPEFKEVLPGLGAFGLRPTREGPARGRSIIQQFLNDIVQHSASQLTQDERLRFWVRESTSGPPSEVRAARVARFLRRPAADTPVLLGYVRDERHWNWIHQKALYNLRAGDRTGAVGLGSRELACEVLLLYSGGGRDAELWSIEGEPRLMTVADMRRLGYEARGDLYFCLPLGRRFAHASDFRIARSQLMSFVERLRGRRPFGTPLATNWLMLLSETRRPT